MATGGLSRPEVWPPYQQLTTLLLGSSSSSQAQARKVPISLKSATKSQFAVDHHIHCEPPPSFRKVTCAPAAKDRWLLPES